LDYSYFQERHLVGNVRNREDKVRELLHCLKISSLSVLEREDFLVCYRTAASAANNKKVICSNAWVQIAINQANGVETKPFDEKLLDGHLEEIRNMTVQEPQKFWPRLNAIFNSCGVALILLPHLRNSGINGATKWLSKDKVMVAINVRGKDADKFWFAMFHEVCHLKQKQVKKIMVSGEGGLADLNDVLESECDKYASDILIPKAAYTKFLAKRDISETGIKRFSDSIGIHPGVVIGRLQHDKAVPFAHFNNLKIQYDIDFSN
jgi:HTH-type transcriptional regulator/antitoxin HigA